MTWTGGTLTQSNAASAIVFNNAGTGIRNIGATIDADTTIANAIDITNSAGIINFTGGLDIDTTSGTGFNATGSGTVTVQGTGNSVATSNGTAVNIANTTIGAAGVTFQSVSANGATNGIVLNNTGTTGTFTVSGIGTTAGSGGTIQNTTGHGISLTNTGPVSLNNMIISNNTGNGINGSDVTDFELLGSQVTALGASTAVNINLGTIIDPLTVNIQNNIITAADGIGIDVRQSTLGTETANVSIANNSIIGNGAGTQNGNGIIVIQFGNGTVNTLIDNNTISGFGLEPIFVNASLSNTGTGTFNSTITNNQTGVAAAGATASGISISSQNLNTLCANINGNTVAGTGGADAIDLAQLNATATLNVTQTGAANVSAVNGGASVGTTGTVNFGQPTCALP